MRQRHLHVCSASIFGVNSCTRIGKSSRRKEPDSHQQATGYTSVVASADPSRRQASPTAMKFLQDDTNVHGAARPQTLAKFKEVLD